jgi:hypothetical protein
VVASPATILKNIIQNINKAFNHRVRLGIMSVLAVNESADFTTLKELLGVTDGNLASHDLQGNKAWKRRFCHAYRGT